MRRQRLEGQGIHLLSFVLLGAALYHLTLWLPGHANRIWGLSALGWAAFSWLSAGMMQAWIAFFWRMELHGGAISARLGKAGFRVFQAGFVLLGCARFLPLIPISLATAGTLPLPRPVSIALIAVTAPFILWAIYGVFVHLGFNRATGADHFEPASRELPLVSQGIYRYVPNAAYAVALPIIYHAGLLWHSSLGLAVAAVQDDEHALEALLLEKMQRARCGVEGMRVHAAALQRREYGAAAFQGDLPLRGAAAEEHRDLAEAGVHAVIHDAARR